MASLELVKLDLLRPYWLDSWSLTRAFNRWFSRKEMSQPMLLLNTWYRYRCLITSEKMGRLVRCYEQNRKGSYTLLDIFPSNRNQVIRQKSLLIGCEVASNKNAARNLALPTKAIFPPCCCFFSGIGVVFLTSPEPSSAVLALRVDG